MSEGRVFIGLVARGVFWVAILLLVGNAAVFLWSEGNWFFSIVSVVMLPFTTFLWPIFAPEAASAWPFEARSGLWILFAVAVVAYPISTFVGGLQRV